MDFHQTFVISAVWDRDELVRFLGQKVKVRVTVWSNMLKILFSGFVFVMSLVCIGGLSLVHLGTKVNWLCFWGQKIKGQGHHAEAYRVWCCALTSDHLVFFLFCFFFCCCCCGLKQSPLLTILARQWAPVLSWSQGPETAGLHLLIIADCPSYTAVHCWQSGLPCWRHSHLEQSASTRHVRTLYVCFLRTLKGFSLYVFLPMTHYRNFCSACAVTVVIFGHLNRSFYLLTLLTYFMVVKSKSLRNSSPVSRS